MTKVQIERIEKRLFSLWDLWRYESDNLNLKKAEEIQEHISEVNQILVILGYHNEIDTNTLQCKVVKSNY